MMRNRIENQTMWGGLLAVFGLFLYADVIGTGRAYGYTTGNVIEFVTGATLLYLAGMNRRRMALAASDRRGRRITSIGCAQTSWR